MAKQGWWIPPKRWVGTHFRSDGRPVDHLVEILAVLRDFGPSQREPDGLRRTTGLGGVVPLAPCSSRWRYACCCAERQSGPRSSCSTGGVLRQFAIRALPSKANHPGAKSDRRLSRYATFTGHAFRRLRHGSAGHSNSISLVVNQRGVLWPRSSKKFPPPDGGGRRKRA